MTDRMVDVLRVLVNAKPPGQLTPNEIGYALGFIKGNLRPTRNGKTQGPAQRVTGALTALASAGHVMRTRRPDGLSGSAFAVTDEGRLEYLRIVQAKRGDLT
jgi:hypothetical protein